MSADRLLTAAMEFMHFKDKDAEECTETGSRPMVCFALEGEHSV